MSKLDISAQAKADLRQIWLYIAQDQPVNADRHIDKLRATAGKLADFPGLGRDCSELVSGMKCFPVGRYNLYYRVSGDGAVELMRVLAADRDIKQIFPGDEV